MIHYVWRILALSHFMNLCLLEKFITNGRSMASELSKDAVKAIENILHMAFAQNRTMLYEHEVYSILSAMGLSVPLHVVITAEDQITSKLLSLFRGQQIVLKIVAAEVIHKESLGGVQVVTREPDRVQAAFKRMVAEFTGRGIAVHGGLLVQRIRYSRELGNKRNWRD